MFAHPSTPNGEFLETRLGRTAVPTLHPSAVLRAEGDDRAEAMAMLIEDLATVRKHFDA